MFLICLLSFHAFPQCSVCFCFLSLLCTICISGVRICTFVVIIICIKAALCFLIIQFSMFNYSSSLCLFSATWMVQAIRILAIIVIYVNHVCFCGYYNLQQAALCFLIITFSIFNDLLMCNFLQLGCLNLFLFFL